MGAFAGTKPATAVLLNYFWRGRREPCGNCDICLDHAQTNMMKRHYLGALSTVVGLTSVFGMGCVVR